MIRSIDALSPLEAKLSDEFVHEVGVGKSRTSDCVAARWQQADLLLYLFIFVLNSEKTLQRTFVALSFKLN